MTGTRLLLGGLALALILSGCGRDEFAEDLLLGPDGPGRDECRVDRDCGSGEFCDRGTCRDDIVDPQVCREGAFRCLDRDTLGFCPDGDGFEVWADCSESGGTCEDGECVERPRICDGGATRCGPEGNVEICTGDRWEDLGTCPPNSRCVDGDCVGADLPDIAVIFADVNPREVQVGGALEVGLEVVNESEARAGAFSCQFQLASGRINPGRDVVLERLRLGPLGPFEGEGVGLRVAIPSNVAPGPYTAYVFCDAQNEVRELSEDNNIGVAGEIFIFDNDGQPDLELVDVNARVGGVIDAGEALNVNVTVCNFGDAAAGPTSVRLHAIPDPNGDAVSQLLGESPLGRLTAGDCQELTIRTAPLQCFEPRVFFLRAVVDPQNRIQERSERNNAGLFERPLEVSCDMMECSGDQFDPDDVRNPPPLEPDFPHDLVLCPGDQDLFELPWEPGGDGQLVVLTDPEFRLAVRVISIEGDAVMALGGGSTEGGIFEFNSERLPLVDSFRVSITGAVPDNGANYNLLASSGDVRPEEADLVIRAVSMTPEPFRAGTRKDVRFTVANNGGTAAGPFSSGIAILPGFQREPPLDALRYIGRAQTRGLGVGATAEGRTFITLPDNLEEGPYTLVVVADIGSQVREADENNNYGVEFFEVTTEPTCAEDQFEPNDSFAAAFTVDAGSYENLSVCNNDDDFYRICPGEPGVLSISVRFDHDLGDIDLQLLNEQGQIIDRRNGVDDEEALDFEDVDGDQCYVLRVFLFGQGDDANRYEMELRFEGEMGDTCTDPYEPNNGFESPSDLRDAVDSGELDFCPQGDPDFYAVALERGQQLTLGVAAGTMEPGSISVTLYGPNRGFLLQRFEREPTITYQAATAGDHFIRLVTSSGADRFPYSFTEFSIE